MKGTRAVFAVGRLSLLLATSGNAQSPQQVAHLGSCALQDGGVIADCRIAYRTAGKLNAERSNAILRTVGFQVRTVVPAPAVPPTAYLYDVDTTRFFLVLVDALGNGASSSPSNSQDQPGDKFPSYTIRDMVNSQFRLLTEYLHIPHLHAVIGKSMGGMQGFEWAVAYPSYVDRLVLMIPSPKLGAYDRLLWTSMLAAIERGKQLRLSPPAIMLDAMRISMLAESTPGEINKIAADSVELVARGQADEALSIQSVDDVASQLRAMLAHDVSAAFDGDMGQAARSVRGKLLLIFSPNDHMVTPFAASAFAQAVGADTLSVPSRCGHNVTICERDVIGPVVRRFLER